MKFTLYCDKIKFIRILDAKVHEEGNIIEKSVELFDIRLCETLKRLRERKGYTQKFIADKLGICRSAYAYYEAGKAQPSLERALIISKIYGITMEQLLEPR